MEVASSIFKFCPLVKQNMDFVDVETVDNLMIVGELCLSSSQHSARAFQVFEIVRCSVPAADGTSVYAYSRHCLQKRYVPTGFFVKHAHWLQNMKIARAKVRDPSPSHL